MSDGRLEHEVTEQHRRLDTLFSAVRESFLTESGAAALSLSISHLQEALEVHFLQEDELYYPALWAVRPEQRERLRACVSVHQQLRALLGDLAGRAIRGERAGALQVFEALAEDFRRHEVREEEVLRDLDPAPGRD